MHYTGFSKSIMLDLYISYMKLSNYEHSAVRKRIFNFLLLMSYGFLWQVRLSEKKCKFFVKSSFRKNEKTTKQNKSIARKSSASFLKHSVLLSQWKALMAILTAGANEAGANKGFFQNQNQDKHSKIVKHWKPGKFLMKKFQIRVMKSPMQLLLVLFSTSKFLSLSVRFFILFIGWKKE